MKKCSTGQGYIRKEVTSYKIHILGRYVPCIALGILPLFLLNSADLVTQLPTVSTSQQVQHHTQN